VSDPTTVADEPRGLRHLASRITGTTRPSRLARLGSATTVAGGITAGAEVLRGDLDDTDGLRAAAADSDGVVHLAFKHDLMQLGDMERAASADLGAIKALTGPIEGTGKPFVGTSGTLLLSMLDLGRAGTEDDAGEGGFRIDAENFVAGLALKGVRSSIVRLAPTVHSDLDKTGYVPAMVGIAREKGFAAYVGGGANLWSAVHSLDAAHLFRLALEHGVAGSRYHAVGDEGVPFRDIAEAIGRGLNVPVRRLEPDAAEEYFGFLAPMVQMGSAASSARTQELLGWKPAHPGLIADIDEGHYFR